MTKHSTLTNPDDLHYAKIRSFTGDPSVVTPDFIGQILIRVDTNETFYSTGITQGQLTKTSGYEPLITLSTSQVLQSDKKYLAVTDSLICTLPASPSIGDCINLSNGDFASFKVSNGNINQRILNGSTLGASGLDSGIDLKNNSDVQLLFTGVLWKTTYRSRVIQNYQPLTGESELTYIPTELETYYYAPGNTLSNINDGNTLIGAMRAAGGTNGKFIFKCTLPTAKTLTSIKVIGGQFNGAFNRPSNLIVYRGDIVNPSELLHEFTDLATANNNLVRPIFNSGANLEYTFEFSRTSNEISVSELYLYGY